MKHLKIKTLAVAVTALLGSTAGIAAAVEQQLGNLKQDLATLQQRIVELEKQTKTTVQDDTLLEDATIEAPTAEDDAVELNTWVSRDDLEGVRSELENYKYDQSRQYERQTVKSVRDTNLYGTVQVRAQAEDQRLNQKAKSSFDIGTALIGVRGNLFKDYNAGKNLEYQLSYGYSKRNDGTNNSNFNLLDAFLRYHVFSTNAGLETAKLNVTLGQQLLPFGLDVQSPEDLRPTITYAAASTNLGLFTRQNGLVVRGDIYPFVDYAANYRAPLLEYAVGVVNGNGSNKTDDNNSKDYIGRVAFTLPVDYASWLRELKVGASYLKGEAKISGFGTTENKAQRDRIGVDLYYNHAPFGATYEYLQGKTDYFAAADQLGHAKSEGHTFTAFYTLGDQFYNSIKSNAKFDDYWPKSVQGYYRFDRFNPHTQQADYLDPVSGRIGEYDIHSLGLNLFFAQTTKFQLQLNHYIHDIETAQQKDSNEVLAQLQYTF